MSCCRCGRSFNELFAMKISMVPVEPKGTPNRKWSCVECADKSELVIDDIAAIFDPIFKKEE